MGYSHRRVPGVTTLAAVADAAAAAAVTTVAAAVAEAATSPPVAMVAGPGLQRDKGVAHKALREEGTKFVPPTGRLRRSPTADGGGR